MYPTDKPLLATETENHAIQYISFQGTIPEGQYGAGTVKIVDKGTFTLDRIDYDKKYVITLKGKKKKGTFALIKTQGKSFLWIKTKEDKKACVSDLFRKLASAIDYPRPAMDREVWDLESFPPKMRPEIKDKLMKPLVGAFKSHGIDLYTFATGVYLSGSMAGNTVQETGDVDIDIEYKKSDRTLEQLRAIVEPITHKKIPGTGLISAYMILAPGDHPVSEGVYDIIGDTWKRGPIHIPTNFDPDKAFIKQKQVAIEIAQKIDFLIREIYRVVKDLKKVDSYNKLYGGMDKKRGEFLFKIEVDCRELNDWYNWIWSLPEAIKDTSEAVYPAFNLGPNWDERYIILKYLGRYEYHNCIAMLYSLFSEDDPYLKVIDQFIPD